MNDLNEKSQSEQAANPTPTGSTSPEQTVDSKADVSQQTNALIEADEQKCDEATTAEPIGFEAVKESVVRKTGSLLHTIFQKIENFSHDIVVKTEKVAKGQKDATGIPNGNKCEPIANEKESEPIETSPEVTTAPPVEAQTPASGKTAAKKVAAKKTAAKKTAAKKAAAKKTASRKAAAKKTATKQQMVTKNPSTKKAAAKKRTSAKKTSPQIPNP